MSLDQSIAVSVDESTEEFYHVLASGHLGWGADDKIKARIGGREGETGRHDFVVLNLSNVTFIDSAGISSLLSLQRELLKRGKLVLCEVPPRIQETFAVVGMSRVVLVAEDLRRAREMFEQ